MDIIAGNTLLEQLRKAKPEELSSLAIELRRKIIQTTANNGGHLSSNLGAIELTIALHRVLRTPEDKLIWDVGHQCYAHKLLTGRWESFDTLRQYGGISGFPKTEESPHDCFDTGHSSTSLSIALGMARARDTAGKKFQVVAVMGDGALTGGEAWEAINDAGHHKDRIILMLNDNSMSIRPNVGGVSLYLARMRSRPKYGELKRRVLSLIGKEGALYRLLRGTKQFLKYLMINGIVFEEMGWTYLGPIDGHNIMEIEKVLSQACAMDEPVLIHVVTEKGRGFSPAKMQPSRFHSTKPFVISTGVTKKQEPESTDVLAGRSICQVATENPAIVALTAAMLDGCGLAEMSARMPERVYDVGIAEQHLVALAAGMASGGMIPYVCVYSTFLQRAWDQISQEVCINHQQVIFAISHTGISGHDGETHHGIYTYNMLLPMPHMTVLSPSTRGELRTMLKGAHSIGGPVAICFAKELPEGPAVSQTELSTLCWQLFEADTPAECCILATGNRVLPAKEAAALAPFPVDVQNARVLKPMDRTALLKMRKYRVILCVEDNVVVGGFGQQAAGILYSNGYTGKLDILGHSNDPLPHGDPDVLYHRAGIDAEGILTRLQTLWNQVL